MPGYEPLTYCLECEAYCQGYDAFFAGLDRTSNPYTNIFLKNAWEDGWGAAAMCALENGGT